MVQDVRSYVSCGVAQQGAAYLIRVQTSWGRSCPTAAYSESGACILQAASGRVALHHFVLSLDVSVLQQPVLPLYTVCYSGDGYFL